MPYLLTCLIVISASFDTSHSIMLMFERYETPYPASQL